MNDSSPRLSQRSDGGLLEAPLLREQIYDRLRSSILSGELRAGTRLSPSELAESFEVSTMPVREALRLLQLDGLIETSPRRWTRVASADPGVAEDLYPILSVLESFAVRTATSAPLEAITRAREANEALAAAAAKRDVAGCLAADDTFHRVLFELNPNRALHEMIADLKVRIRLLEGAYFRVEDASQSLDDHSGIIEALVAEDMEKAGEMVTRNWDQSLRRLRVILANPDGAGAGGSEDAAGEADEAGAGEAVGAPDDSA